MRTDDFEDIKPQETTGGTPDVVEAEGSDGFNEFDSPTDGGGKSLGDVFRDNPLIKIGVVVLGIAVVATALIMFGGKKEDNVSEVGAAVKEREAPGNQTSEAYRDAVNAVNQQRLDDAMRTGQSSIPIPTDGQDSQTINAQNETPPVNIDDPLAGWRAGAQRPGSDQSTDVNPPTDPLLVNNGAQNNQIQQVPMGPDPAAVDALAQAMGEQMKDILAKHGVSGSQIISVTDAEIYMSKRNAGMQSVSAGGGQTEENKPVEILVPAGTIVYAQTLTEANSDVPGPVLARIANGPLAGTRLIGTFEKNDEYLTLNFNTLVIKGVSQSINAVALDPKTTLPGVATEIDHRYWKRVILPAAAKFIEGMGNAIAQTAETTTVNNGTVTSSKSDLNTKQELAAGLTEGTQVISDEMQSQGEATKVLVKVHAGTPVGILFLDPVTKGE